MPLINYFGQIKNSKLTFLVENDQIIKNIENSKFCMEVYQVEEKKINPDVIILCEPWGNGYDPAGFSLRGWGSWNDQVRNSVKGENPFTGKGWIFGDWYGDNDINKIKRYVNGTLVRDRNGLFQKKEHSVNYLESHDGYTLGDFIRLALGDVGKNEVISDVDKNEGCAILLIAQKLLRFYSL